MPFDPLILFAYYTGKMPNHPRLPTIRYMRNEIENSPMPHRLSGMTAAPLIVASGESRNSLVTHPQPRHIPHDTHAANR